VTSGFCASSAKDDWVVEAAWPYTTLISLAASTATATRMAINKAAFFIGFPFVNLLLASNLHNTEANAFVAVIFHSAMKA
jgi:hypothetical protein